MELNVYNTNLEEQGIIDTYSSIIWNRKYFTPTTVSLQCPANANNLALIKKYALIERVDTGECCYIRDVKINDDEKGTIIIAVCDSITSVLYNRAVVEKADTVHGLIINNCISSETLSRNIPNLTVVGIDKNINSIGNIVGRRIETDAQIGGWGLKSYIDHTLGKIAICIVEGLDRSILQSVNPQVVFSSEFGNLLSSGYQTSDIGAIDTVYTNCTMPVGLKTLTPPEYSIQGNAGFARCETMVDLEAKSMDIHQDIEIRDSFHNLLNTVPLVTTQLDSNATTIAMMSLCNNALIRHTENFEGIVSMASGYGSEYYLGDIVTIFNTKWGISVNQRITEVCETFDNTTNSIIPVFGTPSITIMDKIKKG